MMPDEIYYFFAVLVKSQKDAPERIQSARPNEGSQKNAVPMLIDSLELRPGTAATKTEVHANKPFAIKYVLRREKIARHSNEQYK